jgi:hypothetical protein
MMKESRLRRELIIPTSELMPGICAVRHDVSRVAQGPIDWQRAPTTPLIRALAPLSIPRCLWNS